MITYNMDVYNKSDAQLLCQDAKNIVQCMPWKEIRSEMNDFNKISSKLLS
jgi:hypothetical protein